MTDTENRKLKPIDIPKEVSRATMTEIVGDSRVE